MEQVLDIRGKTEQRVVAVIELLRAEPKRQFTYEELATITGAHYDACLYILATLCEVGLVKRVDVPDGPGRPKVHFTWTGKADARGLGLRKRAALSAQT